MHKIIQYRNKCIGCGICQELQPHLWRMSKKDGKATLLGAAVKKDIHLLPISEWLKAETKETAGACPARIIQVV
jgi:ferredoxin